MSPLHRSRTKALLHVSCVGKKKHMKFESAVEYLLGIHRGDLTAHIYRCRYGAHWHIGHRGKNPFCSAPPAISGVILERVDDE